MADRVSPGSFQSAIETLHGYLGDVVGPTSEDVTAVARAFEQHSTKLRLFVNFCQKDDVIRWLAERLHRRFGTDAVIERAMADTLALPASPIERAAFLYQVLVLLKQKHKVDVRELLSRVARGGSIEERWRDFRRTSITTLAADLRAITDRALDLVKDESSVDPDEAFGRVFAELDVQAPAAPVPVAPVPVAPVKSTPAAPPAAAPERSAARVVSVPAPPSLGGAPTWTTILRAAAALAPEDVRGDLAVDAELLELELKKSRPNAGRIDGLVEGFERAGAALGAIAREAAGRSEDTKKPGAAKARAGKKKK